MPHQYDYSEPLRLISDPRLSSYRASIFPKNDSQLLGAYCWNLSVVSSFYPLLQVIEVALRNTISLIAQEHIGGNEIWLNKIKFTYDENEQGQKIKSENVKKFQDNIKRAKSTAKQTLDKKGIDRAPNLNEIISNTDFSTWEYIFDKSYYNGSDSEFLWPKKMLKVFKKLPRYKGNNVAFNQRDIIRRRIESIRSFRNRISHNEPSWRRHDVSTRRGVIENLKRELDTMIELLFWISPKFRKYIEDVGIKSRIEQALSLSELERHMHIFERYPISEISELQEIMMKANLENKKYYFNVCNTNGILTPSNAFFMQ